VKVVRGGQQLTIPNHEVVVGDVMLLDTGDKIVADGHTIEARPPPPCRPRCCLPGRRRAAASADAGVLLWLWLFPCQQRLRRPPPQTHGMVVDEASLTGESDPVKKGQEFDPWVRSGTQVGAHTLSPGRCPLGQA
jgi:Ca2+-transporting ATPase